MLMLAAHRPASSPSGRALRSSRCAGSPPRWRSSSCAPATRATPRRSAAPAARGAAATSPSPRRSSACRRSTSTSSRFNIEGGSDPPAQLADLIALRIERLPTDARRTLQAVAVLGDAPARPSWWRCCPTWASSAATSTARGTGFVSVHDGVVSAPHPLVRDVTLATMPAAVPQASARQGARRLRRDGEHIPLEVEALHAYHARESFEALMLLEQVAEPPATRGDQTARARAAPRRSSWRGARSSAASSTIPCAPS